MHTTICTIGFAGKTAEEFFRLLREAGVKQVVDVREHRIGQLAGFAKYPDIAFFLQGLASIAYTHEPLLAPSPEIRDAYRKSKDWPAYESSFLELMRTRGIPEQQLPFALTGTTALLCSEPRPEKCHRRLVAELLASHWRELGHQVEIHHLFLEKSSPKLPTKRGRHGNRNKTSDN